MPAAGRHSADVTSIDAVVRALYEGVSFPPGGAPDWERLRALFLPEGLLIPPRTDPSRERLVATFDVWKSRSEEALRGMLRELAEKGFTEWELARRTESWGSIAQLFSSYAGGFAAEDSTRPFWRGINSIQLLHDEERWWIVSIAWDVEKEGRALPEELV